MHNRLVVSVDGRAASVRDWQEAVSTYVGRTPTPLQQQEDISCEMLGAGSFNGQIEAGSLGATTISRMVASPNRFRRTLRRGSNATESPLMLFLQRQGRCHFKQGGRAGTLDPGDWCLLDTRLPFEWNNPTGCEQIIFAPRRPADLSLTDLIERGIGRRYNGKTGVARLVHTMINEAFGQLDRLESGTGNAVADAIVSLAWRAVHEQLDAPPPVLQRDTQCARIKAFIEEHLAEHELTVETIALGCAMSVRSVQRAFCDDPQSPVSNYIWQRRIARCALSLRDPMNTERSITDIALSSGFASSSHFSRVFRAGFGVSPRRYRLTD